MGPQPSNRCLRFGPVNHGQCLETQLPHVLVVIVKHGLAQLRRSLVRRTTVAPGEQVGSGIGGLHLLRAHQQERLGISVHQVEVVLGVVVAVESDQGGEDPSQVGELQLAVV